jgi:hypothetical protein
MARSFPLRAKACSSSSLGVGLPRRLILSTKIVAKSQAMAAGLTDHIWTIKELLHLVLVPLSTNN